MLAARNPFCRLPLARAAGAFSLFSALLFALTSAPARGADAAGADLGKRALEVFQLKCAACHSPQAKKPKKFNTVTNLVKLAANPKLVKPGDSAHSKIWTSISEGDMPPDDARTGPLSKEQSAIIKSWIDAGAPPAPAAAVALLVPADPPAAAEESLPPPLPLVTRLIRLIGRFHPLLIHLPIGLIMATAVAEVLWLRTHSPTLTYVVRFCIAVGSIGAVVAGAVGWINAYFHTASGTLTAHRWLGTLAVFWMMALVWLCETGIRGSGFSTPTRVWIGPTRVRFQVMLFAGVVLMAIAAHFGGTLVYGDDYFKL